MRRSSLRAKTVRRYLSPGVSSRIDTATAGLGRCFIVWEARETGWDCSCSLLSFAATGAETLQLGHDMFVVLIGGGQQGARSG
jgi:hypothetical protein